MSERLGLSSAEVEQRRAASGWNEIREVKQHPALLFFRKFTGPTAYLLEIVVILALGLQNWLNAGSFQFATCCVMR